MRPYDALLHPVRATVPLPAPLDNERVATEVLNKTVSLGTRTLRVSNLRWLLTSASCDVAAAHFTAIASCPLGLLLLRGFPSFNA